MNLLEEDKERKRSRSRKEAGKGIYWKKTRKGREVEAGRSQGKELNEST